MAQVSSFSRSSIDQESEAFGRRPLFIADFLIEIHTMIRLTNQGFSVDFQLRTQVCLLTSNCSSETLEHYRLMGLLDKRREGTLESKRSQRGSLQ